MNFEIRKMEDGDGRRVLEILQQGIDGGNATLDAFVPTWEAWNINHINSSRFVIEDDKNYVIGWCALKSISNRSVYSGVAEVSIYLDNVWQGKGLGSILLQKLIYDSEEHGFWMLQSGIFPENKASVSLHQKFGFRIVGKRERIAKMKDNWRDVILMERRSKTVGI